MSLEEKTRYTSVYQISRKNDISYKIRYRIFDKIKSEIVGKKSEGMTPKKAKDILNKRLLEFQDKEDVREESNNSNYSLTYLSELYFQMKQKEVDSEKFLDVKEKKGKTQRNLNREKSAWNSSFGKWIHAQQPFSKIKQKHIDEFILELRQDYSEKTIYNAVILLKSILKHTNVKNDIKIPKKPITARTSYLDTKELKLFLQTMKEEENEQNYLISLVLCTTGMRPNSCLNLKVRDIDLRDNLINVYDFKRKMYYQTNLTSKLKEELTDFVKDRDLEESLFYFVDKYKPFYKMPVRIQYVFDKLFNKNKSGRDKIVPYTLRHSFATNLLKNGTSVFLVQQLLNHSNIETTLKHYSKYIPDFSKSEQEKLVESII